ncbi:MAG: hypothetical protein V1928_02445 [Parcubacteria group bacterium]
MNKEQFPISNVSAEQVIHLILENGVNDEGVIKLVIEWTEKQEKETPNDPLAMIQFNLKRARLYAAAACVDEALENFNAAGEQAWNENRGELYQTIMNEMDQVETTFAQK